MSAFFKAGESFTPSPVIATTSPCVCNKETIRNLCSGVVLAKTTLSLSRVLSVLSSNVFKSLPVMAFSAGKPIRCAMASAVAGASPVIIITRIPALWAVAIACDTSFLGGSIIPTTPNKVRSVSTSFSSRLTDSGKVRFASASVRKPSLAICV